MAIRTIKNLYTGINPHLNSELQKSSLEWQDFHANHIADITRLLKQQLYSLGYTAYAEQGLQIRKSNGISYPQADVLVYDPPNIPPSDVAVAPVATTSTSVAQNLADLLGLTAEERTHFNAVGIYRIQPNKAERGTPVAWIEVLSPSNKLPHADFQQYAAKRKTLLHAGLIFVELDYLHQTPPTIVHPDYTRDAEAYPYRITLFNPHPDMLGGQGHVYSFRVNETLPTFDIPLLNDDYITFNFERAYQRTYQEMLYGNDINYTQIPHLFTSYQPQDQITIVGQMLAILNAAIDDADLQTTTLTPQPLSSLSKGLEQVIILREKLA